MEPFEVPPDAFETPSLDDKLEPHFGYEEMPYLFPGHAIATTEFGAYGNRLQGATMTFFTVDTDNRPCVAVFEFDDWHDVGGTLELLEAFSVSPEGALNEATVDESVVRKEFLKRLFGYRP